VSTSFFLFSQITVELKCEKIVEVPYNGDQFQKHTQHVPLPLLGEYFTSITT